MRRPYTFPEPVSGHILQTLDTLAARAAPQVR